MSITRINSFQAAEGKNEQLFDFLLNLIPHITDSTGNISCEVLRESGDNGRFAVIEKWKSAEAHQQSLAAYPKAEMQAAMALFGAPPAGTEYHA